MSTQTDPADKAAPLARLNPEEDPNGEMTALATIGPPSRSGTGLLAPRSTGMQKLDELMRYATIFASAGMFKGLTSGDMKRQAAMCAVKVIAGDELGLKPMAAMRSIYVFDGSVSLAGPLILALINKHPLYKYRIIESSDDHCSIEFYHREDPEEAWELCGPAATFGVEDARRAQLLGKDNWKTYPRAMYLWRTVSNGAKMYCAEIFDGPVHTPDEINANVKLDASGFVDADFERATMNAAASVAEFDQEILELAKRANWTEAMLTAQAQRCGDRVRLLELLTKTVERTESRGKKKVEPEVPTATVPTNGGTEQIYYDPKPGSLAQDTRKALFGALDRRGRKERNDRHAWAQEHGLNVTKPEDAVGPSPSFKWLSEEDGQKGLAVLTIMVGEERRDRVLLLRCDACGSRKNHAHDKGCPLAEVDSELFDDNGEPRLV